MQYKHSSNKSRIYGKLSWKILAVGIAIILALGIGGYLYAQRDNNQSAKQVYTEDGESVNLNPATDEEKQQAEDRKDEIVKEQNQEQPGNGEMRKANPTIVDASQYEQVIEVRAFVNVVESTGKCTFTFKHSAASVTKQLAAIPDATTTRCTNLSVPRSEFADPGTWDLTVTYSSPTSEGIASAKITVQ